MGIVSDSEAKMSWGSLSRKFCNVFTCSQKFNNRDGEVGESKRICRLLLDEKLLKCFRNPGCQEA